MSKMILGKTGLEVEKNGFGALPIQRVSKEEAVHLLRKAYDAGINFYDSAHAYTDSEEKIGLGLSDVRENIVIATKALPTNPADVKAQLEQSLRMMKTDYIDVYQLHLCPVCYRPGDEYGLYDTLLEAKEKGLIRHIGMTAHSINVAFEAARSGLYETIQFPFSYLSGELELQLVKECKENNIGFIAMKALAGGLITHSKAAAAFQNQFDNVIPIWGVQRECELDEFIEYISNPPVMDDEIRAFIEQEKKDLTGDFCRSCGYCMPCPQGIEIRNVARMAQLIRRSPSASYLGEEWQAKMALVESCTQCGQCKTKCPYKLDIPTLIRKNYEDYKEIIAGHVDLNAGIK